MLYFDFELWERLAREEPDTFEALRQQAIEYEIKRARSSVSKKLRHLQFQVDMKRKLSGSAMGGCIKISQLMMEHLYNEFQPTLEQMVPLSKTDMNSNKKTNKDNIIKLFK